MRQALAGAVRPKSAGSSPARHRGHSGGFAHRGDAATGGVPLPGEARSAVRRQREVRQVPNADLAVAQALVGAVLQQVGRPRRDGLQDDVHAAGRAQLGAEAQHDHLNFLYQAALLMLPASGGRRSAFHVPILHALPTADRAQWHFVVPSLTESVHHACQHGEQQVRLVNRSTRINEDITVGHISSMRKRGACREACTPGIVLDAAPDARLQAMQLPGRRSSGLQGGEIPQVAALLLGAN